MNSSVINISKKTFISVVMVLLFLILLSIGITYIVPKGMFEAVVNGEGIITYNYNNYIELRDKGGINIFKGIFAPLLVLTSNDGLTIIMLSLFLIVISGIFQIMNDAKGIKVIVNKIIDKYKDKKKLLISLITLIFMIFGSFFGLFEEMLVLLPIILSVTLLLGYDSFTGFLVCIVATGFGFASAITNPFTVISASAIIGVSPMSKIWFRFIVFIVMYCLLLLYIFHHIKVIEKEPKKSPTYENDLNKKQNYEVKEEIKDSSKIFLTYTLFLSLILITIITVTSIESIREYLVVFLTFMFLIGGVISGFICEKDKKKVFKSFVNGVISALPAVALVLLASSIKYILDEGMVLATIANSISKIVKGKNIFVVAILIYLVILVLEFFISSSTAKCIFVMGILSCVNLDLSKEMLVLIYLFGDGYTNVLFPTSPVLLIGLSMIGMNYLSWIKKSKWLFLINFIIVIILIFIGIAVGY